MKGSRTISPERKVPCSTGSLRHKVLDARSPINGTQGPWFLRSLIIKYLDLKDFVFGDLVCGDLMSPGTCVAGFLASGDLAFGRKRPGTLRLGTLRPCLPCWIGLGEEINK